MPGAWFTVPHFVEWCGELRLDNGDPFVLEDFQIAFVEDLFAGRLENWLLLPEGNGKTTLIAAIVLYHIEGTIRGSVPVAASSREQAEILYRQAEGFVLGSPRLAKLMVCRSGYRRIVCSRTGSRIQIYAADEKTGDGVIPSLAIVEELHRHKGLGLYRTWRGKVRKRRGAQIVAISTAGEPGSEFEDVREKIRQLPGTVRRGAFLRAADNVIVLHDWAVPPRADVTDIATVKKANPSSWITEDALREDYGSPTMTLEHWSRMKANRPSRASSAAVSDIEWANALEREPIAEGVPIDLGLDVAWKWDTCAMVPLWVRDYDFRQLGTATILVPPRDGTSLSVDAVHLALREIHERNPIATVVMDVTRAEETAAWLADELGVAVVEWTQSNENATIEYEKWMSALRTGRLHHSGDPGLTRHVMNAVKRMLSNEKTRFERKSATRQGGSQESRVIDALSAAAMVHAHYAVVADGEELLADWGVAG